jgi:hypothetical protein
MKNIITYSRLAKICGLHRMTVHGAAKSGAMVEAELGGRLDLDHPAVQKYIIDHMGPKTVGRKKYGSGVEQPPEPGQFPAAFARPAGGRGVADGGDTPQDAPEAPAGGAPAGPAGPLTREALAAWVANAGPKPRAWKLARDFGVSIQVARGMLEDFQAVAGAAAAPPAVGTAPAVAPNRGESVDKFLDMTLRDLRHSFGLPESMLTWLEIRRKAEDLRGREIVNNERMGALIPRELVRAHIFGALEQLAQRLLTDTPQTLGKRIYALAKAGAEPVEAQEMAAELIGAQIRNTKQVIVDNLERLTND